MDIGFVIVAFVITLPLIILVIGFALRREQKNRLDLQKLLIRVGVSQTQKKGIKAHLLEQRGAFWLEWLNSKFKKAGLTQKQDITKLIVAQCVLLFISAFILATKFNVLNANLILMSVLLPMLPLAYLFLRIVQRQTEMRKRFPDMLDSIVRSLYAGHGIDGALAAVAEDMKGPLAHELKEVSKQLTLGISMRDVLKEFQRRVALPEAQFFVITLIIQRESGGQLSAILSELAKLMRRRDAFQAKLKTMTAESRFTAWFIGGAPVIYIAYKYFFDKASMDFFLNDPLGFKLFLISIGLITVGSLILRQMLKMRF
jgi:tight adherence protein B